MPEEWTEDEIRTFLEWLRRKCPDVGYTWRGGYEMSPQQIARAVCRPDEVERWADRQYVASNYGIDPDGAWESMEDAQAESQRCRHNERLAQKAEDAARKAAWRDRPFVAELDADERVVMETIVAHRPGDATEFELRRAVLEAAVAVPLTSTAFTRAWRALQTKRWFEVIPQHNRPKLYRLLYLEQPGYERWGIREPAGAAEIARR
jgi:hypothetical protein